MAETIDIGPNLLTVLSLIFNGLLALWNFKLHKKCKGLENDQESG